eukprot:m.211832 g.211832  ORF g.211832 m.211832 type:complete len:341 (-) comp17157_c1_seq7:597-1619(-)
MDASGDNEVRVVMKTTLPRKYLVTDAPIAIPGNLRRKALSQMINSMLDLEAPEPFDFLVDGEFLRASLHDFIATKNRSQEEVVEIEYILAASPPKPQLSVPHDDWISSIASFFSDQGSTIATGCYDAQVRFWQGADCQATYSGHTRSITSIASLPNDSNALDVVSASMDESIRIWQTSRSDPRVLIGRRHNGTVQSIAAQPTGNMVASGGWDHLIHLWSTSKLGSGIVMIGGTVTDPGFVDPDDDDVQQAHTRKRRKGADFEEVELRSSLAVYTGSGAVVNALAWPEEALLFSAGADHCVRQWDVATAKNVNTMVRISAALIKSSQPTVLTLLVRVLLGG